MVIFSWQNRILFGEHVDIWGLANSKDGLTTYYQFYLNEKQIVAKGFILSIDSILIADEDMLCNELYINHELLNKPIDITAIQQKLARFNIKNINIIELNNQLTTLEMMDTKGSTHKGEIDVSYENYYITRELQYFNGRQPDNRDIFNDFWKLLD